MGAAVSASTPERTAEPSPASFQSWDHRWVLRAGLQLHPRPAGAATGQESQVYAADAKGLGTHLGGPWASGQVC